MLQGWHGGARTRRKVRATLWRFLTPSLPRQIDEKQRSDMQQSLKRYVGRPGAKGAAEEAPPEQPKPSKPASGKPRGKSGLLAALSSQLVRGSDAAAAEAAAASQLPQPLRERPSNQQAAQPPAVQQRCERTASHSSNETTSKQQPTAQQTQQQQQQPQAPPPGMQACPLCGQLLPAGDALQRHINEELDSLEHQEWDEDDWPSSSDQPALGRSAGTQQGQQQGQQRQQQQHQHQWQQQQQQQHQWPQPPRGQRPPGAQQQQQQAVVLVLGGAPSVTVPTDRRRLAQLQASEGGRESAATACFLKCVRLPSAGQPCKCCAMLNAGIHSVLEPCSGSACCLPSGRGSCSRPSLTSMTMVTAAG